MSKHMLSGCGSSATRPAWCALPGGSPSPLSARWFREGRPSVALFVDTVLKAAELAFASGFEGQLVEMPRSPIRLVLTAQTPFFPHPLVFYSLLVADDIVEIVDIIVDEDAWDTGDDPE